VKVLAFHNVFTFATVADPVVVVALTVSALANVVTVVLVVALPDFVLATVVIVFVVFAHAVIVAAAFVLADSLALHDVLAVGKAVDVVVVAVPAFATFVIVAESALSVAVNLM